MTTKTRLSFAITPQTNPVAFKRLFERSQTEWPGVKLTYIGTDPDGNHHMQESRNPTPFVLKAE